MKKQLWTAALAAAMLLTGCSVQDTPRAPEQTPPSVEGRYEDGTLTYTNLVGRAVQEEVKNVCLEAGIAEERVDQLLVWVDDFNQCMKDCESYDLQDAFTTIGAPVVDYGDYYPMSTLWFRTNGRSYGDVLCRIAAFQLMQDHIEATDLIDSDQWECYTDTQWLYSDLDAIAGNPMIAFSKSDVQRYFTLYNPVAIQPGCSEEEMYQAITEAWQARGISFAPGNVSLITIWRQYEDQTAVAHAAVLLESGGNYLLVEKTNPQSPYQAAWFSDLSQVKQYMYESINMEDVRYGSQTGTWVVLQNDMKL